MGATHSFPVNDEIHFHFSFSPSLYHHYPFPAASPVTIYNWRPIVVVVTSNQFWVNFWVNNSNNNSSNRSGLAP